MLGNYLDEVRKKAPLIHNITNYVTINDVANMVLACGASPIMSDEPTDIEEITSICQGLNINMGMLNPRKIESMQKAGKKSNELHHKVLLDPVGAGSSSFRTEAALNLIRDIQFDVIRGNISEIKTLAAGHGTTSGVDADEADTLTEQNLEKMIPFIKDFSRRTGSVIAVTGGIDLVSDAKRCFVIRNGRPEMGRITGTGCQLSGMMTAFLAANPENNLEAAAAASVPWGLPVRLAGNICSREMETQPTVIGSSMRFIIWKEKNWKKVQNMRLDKKDMVLYAVTDRHWLNGESLYSQVEKALKGGATFIQLREKNLGEEEFLAEAKEIARLCKSYHVPFVINDNVEIAKKVDADGVHVGQSDMEALDVRKTLGEDKIIGVTAKTVEQALKAQAHGADYLGVGAVFGTTSKTDATKLDHKVLKEICETVDIPVVAIGGITGENVTELAGNGICGVAVISAVFGQPDIEQATKELKEKVEGMLK